ncbi:toll/interleukin-1 receptor domain-containing protein [Novosphingobium mathurense]|uniref:TIR domain-containing protein n=1 Tax=Novosphingobium mathurense TaxID=428990 RepID=A0A1U6IL31_9SPHN|nr:toll/interleukin-1 receptor domain-containing protein [Novosphingobium mathurense]SLK08718.1 TIR domain-containing protein [Novosphingobium mathurense]
MNDKAESLARDVIFLSHAMPEDTEFAAWLGMQLANAGYRVWSEATQLIGGERFWTDIEEAFDTVIGKTVVVVSGVTRSKNGVLDEIERAVATAERLGIDHAHYVVPLAVSPLKRSDMPIQLGRQNAIQFHPSWAEGLARLLKLLARDDFPKAASPSAVGAWVANWFEGRHRIVERETELMTNGLGITALPDRVRFYNVGVPADALKHVPARLSVPSVINGALLVTFAGEEEIREMLGSEIALTLRADVGIEEFLASDVEKGGPYVSRRDASNHVVNMLRQAWDNFCEARGLNRLELASGRVGWFLPLGMVEGQFVRFVDFDGKSRKRYLYGVKTKKVGDERVVGMHWHYAPRLQFALGDVDEVHVEAHVAFTVNGRELLGDPDKAHKIRRSFCKQWFNEQWRTLHLAYFSFLSDGTERIELPVSRDQVCVIDTRPERYSSPVTFEPPPRKVRAGAAAPAAAEEEEVPEDDPDVDEDDVIDPWDDFDAEGDE